MFRAMIDTRLHRAFALSRCALALTLIAPIAAAQNGLGTLYAENWGFFQKNENGSDQWKYEPRLYVPFHFDNGWTFTQRVDVPMIYTNTKGAGNPGGGYSGGIGDVFIEEIFETPEIAKSLSFRASVRFVFPTGKQSPFGSSQYQWAPMAGMIYRMPDALAGVTLAPYVRYFSGFDPQYANVTETRKLDLYPAATFGLGDRWSMSFYPDNPVIYNESNHTWFVPLDLMFVHRVAKQWEYGFGGAWKLGHPSDPAYRYIIDARLTYWF
jgi:hypothetical protein